MEVLSEASLVVSCQTKFNPPDSEFELWLAAVESMWSRPSGVRLLVCTDGGHLTRPQLDRLHAQKRPSPVTAIVSPSRSLRFFGSALTVFNPTIRCYAPAELFAACVHIGVDSSYFRTVNGIVERLQAQLALRESA